MKIIFFGEDSFSNVVLQSLIDAKFDVVLVVSPFYDNLIHKRLEKTLLKESSPKKIIFIILIIHFLF